MNSRSRLRFYDPTVDEQHEQLLKLGRPKILSRVSLEETAASALTDVNSLFGNVTAADDDTTKIEMFIGAHLVPITCTFIRRKLRWRQSANKRSMFLLWERRGRIFERKTRKNISYIFWVTAAIAKNLSDVVESHDIRD